MADTIFALSSGSLPSGVAIIRLSGPRARYALEKLTGSAPEVREAKLLSLVNPHDNQPLDEALCLRFAGPHSFTGEDVVELHCHGGVATVEAVLNVLSSFEDCRLAEAGEFSRRAFENGKMDLTELEGLSDLIAAQTDEQRKLALQQSGGSLRRLYDGWRSRLIRFRALIEAEFDFSDEDDIPGSVSDQVWSGVTDLLDQIRSHLDDGSKGEIIRDGFKIALLGKPNAGKSSLLNALAKRDVAIVTPQAGTTRDVVEVSLNFEGALVQIFDTAGLRESDDEIEMEGMRRAHLAADSANLVLWLQAVDDDEIQEIPDNATVIRTKSDLSLSSNLNDVLTINTKLADGIEPLLTLLRQKTQEMRPASEASLISRKRHRDSLEDTVAALEQSLSSNLPLELRSESLRRAAESLGRITGRIDVEDLLDVIFSEFCVGK